MAKARTKKTFFTNGDLEQGPDRQVIATNIVKSKRKLKKTTPSVVDLAAAITAVTTTDTIEGSSTLEITIDDGEHVLLDSGFFDADADGKLDDIDVNYPDASRFWWRLTQCRPNASGEVTMVFMERAAVYLMRHRGPLKVSRAKKTRAEFFKLMTDEVKAGGGITLHSYELHKKQSQGKDDAAPKDDSTRDANKDGGIHTDEDLKIKKAKATRGQLKQVERALDVADKIGASARAVLAMVCAGIGESEFKAIMNRGGSKYGGVFQGNVGDGVFELDDTEEMAESFLKGGKGYQGGGAISLADAHPEWGPGLIAVTVEGSRSNFGSDEQAEHFYGQWKSEAEKLIEAYGGGFGGTTYRKQYNFQRGTTEKKNESSWDCARRLADEVNWAWFLDGNRAYFDSETTLVKRQKPAAIIDRDSGRVIDWEYDWDARHICTEMNLTMLCDDGEFRAGQVLKLTRFGPASTGSTVKRPGVWLIVEIVREGGALASEFTLRQPEDPDKEPAAEVAERGDASDESGGDLLDVCKRISDKTPGYLLGGGHGPKLATLLSSQRLDCSSSTSLALYRADMMEGDVAQVSGWFASSWGEKGRGDDFTVWANAGHVFIQSEGGGRPWRFDTGGPGGGRGPKVHYDHRPTTGFTPRHWGGG